MNNFRLPVFCLVFVLGVLAGTPCKAQMYSEFRRVEERKSDDVSSFRRWMWMLECFETQLDSAVPASPGIAGWKSEIQSLKGLPRQEQLERINLFLNNMPYVNDMARYGKREYWRTTPERFFKYGGDCKDYAIAKYVSLRALGFSVEQLRIAVVWDKIKKIPHAILTVKENDNTYVLDNQIKKIERAVTIQRYEPIFSINSESWWQQQEVILPFS